MNEMVQCCDDRKLYESERFHAPYAELKCLMLFNGQRYLTVKDLAGKLDVAKSRITKIVDGLVKKGLVERIEDPKDARVKLIGLTPAGKKAAREFDAFHKEIHRGILLQISPGDRKNVLSNLEVLRSAMEAVKEQLK
jgi:DNA-binding MarR family transcriptional regulator